MSARIFAHWTAVTLTAAAVCLIGIALAPTTTRKDRRS